MKTFRVLSMLLTYPGPDLVAAVPEMKEILEEEGLVGDEDRKALEPLFAELTDMDMYDLQARYVELFDQSRSRSLHLFEHVHGESRDRGQAMVSLLERYREAGLELNAVELPDFLPVFLEYLSQLPLEDARQELAEPVAVIATLCKRLAGRANSYAAVLTALEHLAVAEPRQSDMEELAREEAEESAKLPSPDAEWQEEPVDFSRREASFVGRQRARSLGAAIRRRQ